MIRILSISVFLLMLLSPGLSNANNNFPGRLEFPAIATYEKKDLFNNFKDVIIVDTRSPYEYQTLRINGAVNIPVSSKTFKKEVKLLRNKSLKPIVFYCNGRSCFKSYKAVKKAKRAGIKNTFAYDAGMFEWAKTFPQYSTLLGQSPVNPADIISGTKYKKHLISPKTFGQYAFNEKNNGLVLDIRDSQQRAAGIGLFLGKERWASIENPDKIKTYIEKAKAQKQPIYIYDEVGKQVRWLQYALEEQNVKNYFFMDKGAKGYIEKMVYNR